MTEQEDDLDLGLLGNFIIKHPETGEVWLAFVANCYLGWLVLRPVFQHQQGALLGLAILAPLWLGFNAIAFMLMRLMRLMRKINAEDRERAREQEVQTRESLLMQAHHAFSEHLAVLEAREVERSLAHGSEQCPGPPVFPSNDIEQDWTCAMCATRWSWTYGLQWEQRVEDPDDPISQ